MLKQIVKMEKIENYFILKHVVGILGLTSTSGSYIQDMEIILDQQLHEENISLGICCGHHNISERLILLNGEVFDIIHPAIELSGFLVEVEIINTAIEGKFRPFIKTLKNYLFSAIIARNS
jgi:hypothetical protein